MLSRKPWRADVVLLFITGIFVCLTLGMIVGSVFHKIGLAGFRSDYDFGFTLLGTLCLQGVAWPLMFAFFRVHGVQARDGLGFSSPHATRAILKAIVSMIIALPLIIVLLDFSIRIFTSIGWETKQQAAVTMIEHAALPWTEVYLALFTVLIAPVAEEFIFRGALYPLIKQAGFPRLAFLGVNLAFAAIHLDLVRFLPLFVLGLIFTWLYEITDNLLAPITAHIIFNTVNLIWLFLPQTQILRLSR
jgi:membrane protease YdiL (CAAX protease family)